MPTGSTNAMTRGGGTPTPTPTQTKEVQATAFPTVVTPDSGYALSQATVTAPANLTAENIKKDVTIAGVTGSFEGSSVPAEYSKYDMILRAKASQDINTEFIFAGEDWNVVKNTAKFSDYQPDYVANFGMFADLRIKKIVVPDNLTPEMYMFRHVLGPTKTSSGGVKYNPPTEIIFQGKLNGLSNSNFMFDNTLLSKWPEGLDSTLSYSSSFMSSIRIWGNSFEIPEGLVKLSNINLTIKSFIDSNETSSSFDKAINGRVILPSTVTDMNGYVSLFYSSEKDKHTLVMKATSPPTLSNYTLNNAPAKIIVPIGTLATYQAATNWSQFADIMEEATQ